MSFSVPLRITISPKIQFIRQHGRYNGPIWGTDPSPPNQNSTQTNTTCT